MASSNFAPALALVLSFEGGFVDDPQDPGGATCWGVTLDALSAWRGHPCTVADVRALTSTSAAPLYRARYWSEVHGDELPAGLDLLAFDGSINQGVSGVTRMLQRAAGVIADGQFGPATLAAIDRAPVADLIAKLKRERSAEYHASSGFPRFGAGWMRRLDRMAATASAWAAKAHPVTA